MTFRQIAFVRTHDVEILATLFADAKSLGLMTENVLDLSEYAVDARYPGMDANLIGKEDSSRAVAAASHVGQAIRKALNLS